MKINIASYGGRNWLLDLARELESHGHDVCFYSYVPTKRAKQFGLKGECNKSYFLLALPFLALMKLTKRAFWSLFIFHYFFDHYVGWFSKPCDVFIGHSPMHVYALNNARKKHGAKIILERGTSHVLNYIKLLKGNPVYAKKEIMPKMFLKRDLMGYEIADYISVPSEFSYRSFIHEGVSKDKIFINSYGVNLKEFEPTFLEGNSIYDIIVVGQWSYRKGCDLLAAACKKRNYSLIHVGSIVDLEFPTTQKMTHIDPVVQKELIKFYSQSRIFVFPSREDGFGLVLPQAIVCGLPMVCSRNTGGPHLKNLLTDKKWIIEMQEYSVDELVRCIDEALILARTQEGKRSYTNILEDYLSWEAYGRRYNDFLEKIVD